MTLVDAGAGLMLVDSQVVDLLGDTAASLMSNVERRRAMTDASRKLGRPEAVKRIIEVIEKVCGPFSGITKAEASSGGEAEADSADAQPAGPQG